MPGVERHARDGVIAGLVVAAAVGGFVYREFGSVRLASISAATVFIAIFVGVMVPDTDIKSSKPYRWAVSWGTVLGAAAIGYLVWEHWRLYLDVLGDWVGGVVPARIPMPAVGLLGIGVAVIGVRMGVARAIDRVTGSHRTRTHNPVILTGVAVASAGILWIVLPSIELVGHQLRPYVAVGVPGALLAGSLVHVGRDWIT